MRLRTLIPAGCLLMTWAAMNLQAQTQTIIATITNAVPVFQVSTQVLAEAIEQDFNDGTTILEVMISGSDGVYYLIGRGMNGTISITRAYLLNGDSGGNLRTTDAETHTCTGAPCSSCEFFYEDKKIKGCNCMLGDRCNHTISAKTTRGYIGPYFY